MIILHRPSRKKNNMEQDVKQAKTFSLVSMLILIIMACVTIGSFLFATSMFSQLGSFFYS